jgi:hypothetical protein
MSSHVLTHSSLHLHRARIFFLAGNTQHVESRVFLREVVRALAALGALAAWVVALALLA